MPTLPRGTELFIILFIVLLFFGAKKLPGLAGSIGTSMKEFRRARETEDKTADTVDLDSASTDGSDTETP
jgi:sec-independent protein translocase protein TatA